MRRFSFFKTALVMAGLLGGPAAAQQLPAFQWASGVYTPPPPGSFAVVPPLATAIAPNGDVYTSYGFRDSISISGQTYFSTYPGANGCAVVHHDLAGTPVGGSLITGRRWAAEALRVDATGNLYAAGWFLDRALYFGADSLVNPGGTTPLFLAKWNPSGTLQWTRAVNNTVAFLAGGQLQLAVDDAGYVTLAGEYSGSLSVGSISLTAGPMGSAYCLRFDSGGVPVWGWQAEGATATLHPKSLAADPVTGTLTLLLAVEDSATAFTWRGQPVGTARDNFYWLQLDGSTGALRHHFATRQFCVGQQVWTQTLRAGPFVASAGNDCTYLAFTRSSPCPNNPDSLRIGGVAVPVGGRYLTTVLARLGPTGVPQWIRVIAYDVAILHLQAISAAPAAGLLRGAAGGDNTLYVAGAYARVSASGTPTNFLGFPLPPTTTTDDEDGFVAAIDGLTGQGLWVKQVTNPANLADSHQAGKCLSVAASGQVALAGLATCPVSGPVLFDSISLARGPVAFTAKLLPAFNQVAGTVFVDNNLNGAFDPADAPWGGLVVECQPEGTFFTTAAGGGYYAVTDLGQHTVRLAAPPLYYTLPNPPAPAFFPSYGTIAAGRDFALQPLPNQQDLRVSVTPVTRARPGFALRYRVTYRNVGTTPLSGTLALQLDSRLTYLGNTGGATHAGNALAAAYAALAPQQSRSFDIQFQVPTSVAAGTVLVTAATIEPVAADLIPADNVETNQLTVTASYGPNDIQVNHITLNMAQVAAGEWLEYTIRFENLGTDTAFSVLLRDSLPADQLDLSTLQPIAWSHDCTLRLGPGGWLAVQFPNILLPYRNINALGSMGFVRFRVRPRGTLAPGDVVPNQAAIHFDYNAPVITNTALTTVQNGLGLSAAGAGPGISVWPNPTSGALHVETTAAGPLYLTLLDAVGRPVRTLAVADARRATVLDVRGLPAGLYLLRGQPAAGSSFVRRVVVR